jgi:hypothetical protein
VGTWPVSGSLGGCLVIRTASVGKVTFHAWRRRAPLRAAETIEPSSADPMPVACRGTWSNKVPRPYADCEPRFDVVVPVQLKLLFKPVSEPGTDNRRRRTAEPSFPRLPRGRYRSTDRSERLRIRALPAFFARLHTADHRRFRPSKDQCFGSPLRVLACRSQCRRIAIVRPGAGRDKSPKRPLACRHKDSPRRC